MGFGFHAIQCTKHPHPDGYSLSEVAAMVDTQVGNQSVYDPLMDNHLSFWKWDLQSFVSGLDSSAPTFKYKFTSPDDNVTYYSVLTRVCEWTWVEVFSSDIGTLSASDFTTTDIPRQVFKDWNTPGSEYFNKSQMYPITLSRAVTDMAAMKTFYETVMGGVVLRDQAYDDGSHWVTIKFTDALAHMQFVKRPERANSSFTVQNFIDVHNKAHDEAILSPLCGFDQYIDDHWAYDTSKTLDDFRTKFISYGYKYKEFKSGQIYVIDPSGWGLQLDGRLNNIDANAPDYIANCEMNNSCDSQGYCTSSEQAKLNLLSKGQLTSFLQ